MDAPLANAIPHIEALAQRTLDIYRLPGIALGIAFILGGHPHHAKCYK